VPECAVRVEPTLAVPLTVGVEVVKVPELTAAVAVEVRAVVVYPVLVPVTVIVFPTVPLVGV
jgi:hypothetical protein